MLAAALPGVATAQAPLPPSLSVDSAFAPLDGGIARDNFPGTTKDVPFGVAVDGDRIYTVGESGGDVAIVARRSDGALDTGFGGDGRLKVDVSAGRPDIGMAIVVLPDRRIRVLASTNENTTNTADTDVALIGRNHDGTPDLTFGNADAVTDGKTVFRVGTGTSADTPSRMSADASGRLAITGATKDAANRDNSFISLRAADGSPISTFGNGGSRIFDRGLTAAGGSNDDRGIDVAFRPGGGLVALLEVDTNGATTNGQVPVMHAFTEAGADDGRFGTGGDLVLSDVGEPDTLPRGLLVHEGRLWVTGSTRIGSDTDAFLARVEADGRAPVESRRFDMRGRFTAASVVSRGIDLEVLPGDPETLVVVGSIGSSGSPTSWAAAAFNRLDGPLASAGYGDVVIPTGETAELVGVAAGAGWLATAGKLSPSTSDSSFGTARLLVDADKRCDLALDILEPLELEFQGNRPAPIMLRVSNDGSRRCAGTVSVPATYRLRLAGIGGPIGIGPLFPGAEYTSTGATLTYGGARRRDDVLAVTVAAPGDVNAENDTRRIRVTFSYCDVRLRPAASIGLAPTEGSRRFEFSVENLGSVPCRRVRLAAGRGARRRGASDPFTIEPGRSVSEEIRAAVAGPRRVGRRARVVFRARAEDDVDPKNDSVAISPVLVGVGDTNARIPRSRTRRLSGRAVGGRGPVKKRRLRVTKVDVAVRRLGAGCRWLASRNVSFRKKRGRRCDRPVWLRAAGTRRWEFALARALPAGRYVLYSRATIAAGFGEASFSARDRNRIIFRAR